MKLIHLKVAEHINDKMHIVMHFTYCCLVFTESHGLYGYAAGGIAIFMITGGGLTRSIKKLEKQDES